MAHNLFKKLQHKLDPRSTEIETEVLLICGHSLTYNQLKSYLKTSFDKNNIQPVVCPVENCDEHLKLISEYSPDEAEIYEKCTLRIAQYNKSVRRRSKASDELLGYLKN